MIPLNLIDGSFIHVEYFAGIYYYLMDKESLRRQALEDSDKFAGKSRFGLFSHPISTAVGDNGPYQSTLRTTSKILIRSQRGLRERKTPPSAKKLSIREVSNRTTR